MLQVILNSLAMFFFISAIVLFRKSNELASSSDCLICRENKHDHENGVHL